MATIGAITLVIGGSSFTGAWAQDAPAGVPFPVFKIVPNNTANASATTPEVVPKTTPIAESTPAVGIQQVPVIEIKPDSKATTTDTEVTVTKPTATPSAAPSNVQSEVPKPTPVASEPRTQTTSTPTQSVASPTLATTGAETTAAMAIGFLFTGIGLTFLWFALAPAVSRQQEFAFVSYSNISREGY